MKISRHFTFTHNFARCSLNRNSIAIYKNQKEERLLIHEVSNKRTINNIIVLSKKEWNDLLQEVDHLNDVNSLAVTLDKFFGTELFKNNNEYLEEVLTLLSHFKN